MSPSSPPTPEDRGLGPARRSRTSTLRSPEDVVALVHLADESIASRAVDAASSAFPMWSRMAAPARGEILRRAGDLLDTRADAIGHDLAREEGKTLGEGVGETRRAAAIFRYYAAQTLEPDGETYPSASPRTFLFARREPVGVVTAITPWNFPIAIPAWKLAPALAYGNTVVWKPAELVPLTSVRLLEALLDAGVPEGVLNLVVGRGSVVGDTLVTHPSVDAISFTGSNSVGRAIQLKATERGKKVQLELGGKNPAVVLADADLELAAEHVARGAFLSAGQKCTATSRVIIDQAVFEPFAERLAQRAVEWPLGDALDPTTKVGPLASDQQLQTVLGYLETARTERASIVAGGDRNDDLGSGYFVRPTVLTDVDPTSTIVREEIFGPVAALLAADSYEDAVEIANDTPFGLSASVFTNDLDSALRFARDIRAGVVKVNQESAGLEYHVPFGGTKGSSSGSREQGKAAREFYTEWKTIYIDPGTPGG
ncbi:MAG: aldehyde dehydrogenase family protein [Gaiella sp.]|nr:aldehyde dehydrogenase family protein [Gaiella sp.]